MGGAGERVSEAKHSASKKNPRDGSGANERVDMKSEGGREEAAEDQVAPTWGTSGFCMASSPVG